MGCLGVLGGLGVGSLRKMQDFVGFGTVKAEGKESWLFWAGPTFDFPNASP